MFLIKISKNKTIAGSLALSCVLVLTTGGCYSKTKVSAKNMRSLLVPGRNREIIFKGKKGSRVRLGPNSKIRFYLATGGRTGWIQGRRLHISYKGAWIKRRGQKILVAPWNQVVGAQIENLSGGKTYLAVVGAVVIAGTIIILVAGSGKGGGGGLGKLGKGLGKAGKAVAKGGKAVAKGAARASTAVARGVARGVIRGTLYGPRVPYFHMGVYIDPPPSVVIAAPPPNVENPLPPPPIDTPPRNGEPPPPPPPPGYTPPGPEGSAAPPGAAPPPGNSPPKRFSVPETPAPMFSKSLQRRSKIRYMVSLEGGSDFVLHDGMVTRALVGLRLYDTFELGLGAKLMMHRGEEAQTLNEDHRTSWMAFARLAFNFDMDSRRIVALPAGIDVGVGHAQIDIRALLGIRFRVMDSLHLGIYPFNPTYTRFKDTTLKRKDVGWWSFPTSVSLTFGF